MFFTVVVGVYITVLIANMGGYVDDIRRGQIREGVALSASLDPTFRQLPEDERTKIIEERVAIQEARFGLDQPFVVRSLRYLTNALTLNLGFSEGLTSDSGSRLVSNIILERLPSTLVLFGTANLILFFLSLFLGLSLSRRYGSFFDKLVLGLAPTSAAPGWFYGLFLILIFSGLLQLLPFGGMVSAPPPENPIDYALSLMEHMILPVMATLLSAVFLTIYNWRTFFLIYASEDYVEMAKAKGLPDRMIEQRYVLRPTLPNIVTSFALLLITLWTGAIILETVFNWPGIGQLYFRAIGIYDTPVILANTVVYAYLLSLTVFLLDFIYALVDPRVRVGEGSKGR
ncbi:MAG: ABC transporter permease [Chloroflexi bacterium]|nr:ABC transporter permease [Chloroflexota bacterium]MBK6709932.1 ABC transporter permease [Chloroflexota bacterium]MBK7178766.1 ABC transporter permease [Chloroflexota bacterium]MBK7917273.1 ABC transporter permease [Chloroflexota bacterium]MBK8932560.1 ABC transporter permease [Chloroflexota bacterium]